MYTGIVQAALPVLAVEKLPGLLRLEFVFGARLLEGLTIGASVAVDGVCLTVAGIDDERVQFDVMQQTLSLTTLGALEAGSFVNIERSARQGDEIGGHILSGHIDGTAEVAAVEVPDNNRYVWYRVAADMMPYIFNKGFIGLNGCSLTVADVDREQCQFKVCYIPETLRVTTHGQKQPGDRVNVEIDRQTQVIVDTVRALLAANPQLLNQSDGKP